MGQPGFFDLDKRLEAISAKGDPLEALNSIVAFESFRADIEAVVRPSAEERKSNAGRKPFDAVMMFKIRRYAETDASVHDSQKLDEILDKANASNEVWADSAYRSAEAEAKLKEKGYKSRIHRRGARNHPLSERQKAANTTRSRVRARVEHVFGDQENGMGGIFVRTIGMARAAVKIGMMNLVYNMRRFVWLERVEGAPG